MLKHLKDFASKEFSLTFKMTKVKLIASIQKDCFMFWNQSGIIGNVEK